MSTEEDRNENLSAKVSPEEVKPPREGSTTPSEAIGDDSIPELKDKKETKGLEKKKPFRDTKTLKKIVRKKTEASLPDWVYAIRKSSEPAPVMHSITSMTQATRIYASSMFSRTTLSISDIYDVVNVASAVGLQFHRFRRVVGATVGIDRACFGLSGGASAPGVALRSSSMFSTARELLVGEKPSEVGSALRMNLAQIVGDVSLLARSNTVGVIQGSNTAACDQLLLRLFMYAAMDCTFTERSDPLLPGAIFKITLPLTYSYGSRYWPLGNVVDGPDYADNLIRARVCSLGDFFRVYSGNLSPAANWEPTRIGDPSIEGIAVVPVRSDWSLANQALVAWLLLFCEYPYRFKYLEAQQVGVGDEDDEGDVDMNRPTSYVRLPGPYTKILFVVVDQWKALPTGFSVTVGQHGGPFTVVTAPWDLRAPAVVADQIGTQVQQAYANMGTADWEQVLTWWRLIYNSEEAWQSANLVMKDLMCLRGIMNWRFGVTVRGSPAWHEALGDGSEPFDNINDYYDTPADAPALQRQAGLFHSALGQSPVTRANDSTFPFDYVHALVRPFSHVYSLVVASRMVSYANLSRDGRRLITLMSTWMGGNEALAVGVDLLAERLGIPHALLRSRGPTSNPGIQQKLVRTFRNRLIMELRKTYPLAYYAPKFTLPYVDLPFNQFWGVNGSHLMIIPYGVVPGQTISKYTKMKRHALDDSASFVGMKRVPYESGINSYDLILNSRDIIKDEKLLRGMINACCVGDWINGFADNLSSMKVSDLRGGDPHDLVIPYVSPTSGLWNIVYENFHLALWTPSITPIMCPKIICRNDYRAKMSPRFYFFSGFRSLFFGKNRIFDIQTTVTTQNLSYGPDVGSETVKPDEIDEMADDFLN
jgi:hypothetical protein